MPNYSQLFEKKIGLYLKYRKWGRGQFVGDISKLGHKKRFFCKNVSYRNDILQLIQRFDTTGVMVWGIPFYGCYPET